MKSVGALAIVALVWTGCAVQAASAQSASQEADPDAAQPMVSVSLSPSKIQVGDLLEAQLAIELAADAPAPIFPNWQRHWGDAEIREVGAISRAPSAEGSLYTQTVTLTAFRPGSVELPAQTVVVPGDDSLELLTEPASFEVISVLPEEAASDAEIEPKADEPPRPLPLGSRFWWTAGVLSLVAAALVALLLARRREDSTFAGVPVDPWDALEAALAKLSATADPEAVFTGLSLELRRYLGRTLAFPAAESTTTELRRRLLRSGLPPSVAGDVVRLLTEADTVKFARKTPQPGRVQECLASARTAAEEVRRFLAPRVEEASDEEAA